MSAWGISPYNFHLKGFLFFSFVSNHPIVLGPNNTNLPKIFSIIAEGEMHEAIKHEDPCAKRLANVVRQVQVSRFGYIGEGGIKLFFCLFFHILY